MSSSLPEDFRLRGTTFDDVEIAAALLRAEEEELRGHSDWAWGRPLTSGGSRLSRRRGSSRRPPNTENPTGATRLYKRAGMRVINENVVYEKVLT